MAHANPDGPKWEYYRDPVNCDWVLIVPCWECPTMIRMRFNARELDRYGHSLKLHAERGGGIVCRDCAEKMQAMRGRPTCGMKLCTDPAHRWPQRDVIDPWLYA